MFDNLSERLERSFKILKGEGKIPFVVIRSISDDASGHAPVSYESFFKEAAQRAVALTEEMLKEA